MLDPHIIFDLKVLAFGILVAVAAIWVDRWYERRLIIKEIVRLLWIEERRKNISKL